MPEVIAHLNGFVPYHEFKEKPGLLESSLPDAPTAHNPLQGQLLVEKLGKQGRRVNGIGRRIVSNREGEKDKAIEAEKENVKHYVLSITVSLNLHSF